MNKPLVSILIPAYNSQRWISETLESAIGQTWPHKEVIVVDDGSKDETAAAARRFASAEVKVVTVENGGAAAARNHAYRLSQGEYIQWLDADDLLAPDKIERQLAAHLKTGNTKKLLSSSWAHFAYRASRARFVPTSLWRDLSPTDWLVAQLSKNLHMQTATWLTSRELAEVAGPWNTRLISDDDGEYFCRILMASDGTLFVPEAKVFYRVVSSNRWSFVGTSDKKKDALLLSMKLHIQYLSSLEMSERVQKACLTYMQGWLDQFYPERPDIVAELQAMAAQMGGHLQEPCLRWKYAWLRPVFGWAAAKRAQMLLPQLKSYVSRSWDKAMFDLEARRTPKPAS